MTSLVARHPDVAGIGNETSAFLDTPLAYSAGAIHQWDTYAQQSGASAFVEKTPGHVHHLRRILRALVTARIVFTVRDPRDNVASLYERSGDLEQATRRYMRDNAAGLRFVNDPRVMVAKYEDLVADAAGQMEAVFRHCGLPPVTTKTLSESDHLYRHWESHTDNRGIRAQQVARPIYDSTGSWRNRLTDPQAEEVARATAPLAEALGYTPTTQVMQ